jgi:hypothetical protein
MRADAVRADRHRDVRVAARAWASAGTIDEDTRSKIDALYLDDRQRLGKGLAVPAGTATFIGGIAVVATIRVMTSWRTDTATGVLFLALAGAFAFATELQTRRWRRANAGAELATALLAALLLCAGAGVIVDDIEAGLLLSIAALGFGAGAYRWGFATNAGLAALFTLLALARIPGGGRMWWIGGCLIALVLTVPRMHRERLAPAHRRCLRVVFAAALLGLYFAVHYDGVKAGVLEWVGDEARSWGRGARGVSAALTALVPLAILTFGVRRRDRLAIPIGALLIGVSISTWRYHWPWAPLWLTLVLGGAACFVTAALVRRFLDRAPGREWRGITADPLFDDPHHAAALRVAAIAATLGHAPQASSGDRPFQAGGGTSGGGGAQGQL